VPDIAFDKFEEKFVAPSKEEGFQEVMEWKFAVGPKVRGLLVLVSSLCSSFALYLGRPYARPLLFPFLFPLLCVLLVALFFPFAPPDFRGGGGGGGGVAMNEVDAEEERWRERSK